MLVLNCKFQFEIVIMPPNSQAVMWILIGVGWSNSDGMSSNTIALKIKGLPSGSG